ncbi:MAG: helix-turn-helix domain-containing protein [Alphaproteobacteria bacterium]|jgi:DNA-binding Xre family transcriptional regulator|nr:helix-turn-helix domain-containing protein [Alphaproteobacteria bacterium]
MARKMRITESNLTKILKEKGYTFKELGEYLGVSTQQAQKYGNGDNELSLKLLLETCKFLDCYPQEIYPEIELYDKGFNIPKTQKLLSNLPEAAQDKSITINNTTTNVYKSNFFEDLFSNIKLMDINSRGALLFKIAVFLIVVDAFIYVGFRLFGYTYAPFIGADGLSGQLMWQIVVFTFPLSFILPLLIKHWSVYVLTFSTFHGILSLLAGSFLHITINYIASNQVDPHALWLIKGAIALILTLIYAWIVKTYLRKPIKSNRVKVA